MAIDPLYAFVFFGLFSPGPNVILLTRSGARFGFRPTLPHILGVALGVGVIACVAGLGAGQLLVSMPALRITLQIVSALWILTMAYRLWVAEPGAAQDRDRPMGFGAAILFQWVNPKVWAVAMAAAFGFPGGGAPLDEALRLGLAFSSINLGVCLFWTWAGSLLALLLTQPRAWRWFNRSMAAALAVFALALLMPGFEG